MNTEQPSVTFNASDRCDRCGAQAYAAYYKETMELMFCLHHAKEHNLALEACGWVAAFDYRAIEALVDAEPVIA